MSIRDAIWQRVRAAWYTFDFFRKLPFADRLGRAIHAWETRRGFGDSPKAASGWDAQFSAGQWDYMLKEGPRYTTIVSCLAKLAPEGEFLDVGCGEGILFSYCKGLPFRRYVGVDISAVAIDKLRHLNDSRHEFVQGSGDDYTPSGQFDVIIFNESLYYLQEPVVALRRYANHLKQGGLLLISTYTESRRALAILRDAKVAFPVVEELRTEQDAMSWYCTVLRGRAS